MKRILLLGLIAILWIAAQSLVPASVYWRDSGEFVLTAFFLDVAHPPGYPAYSQMANLFALLPLGPIAWRVGLFSAAAGVLLLLTTSAIGYRVLVKDFKLPSLLATLLSLIPAFVLTSVPYFLKQSVVPEGYVLNALFLNVLFLLYHSYLHSNDLRPLLAAAFLGGLALGNHVSIGGAFIPVFVLILVDFRRTRRIILPAVILGCLGLAVFSYVPIRAKATLPLNTGKATTARRFAALVTDQRDFQLRSEHATPKLKPLGVRPSTPALDFEKISSQFRPALLPLALIGLLILAWRSPKAAVTLFGIGASNYLFFKGWNPDPWIPLYTVLSLLPVFAVGGLFWHRSEAQTPAQLRDFGLCTASAVLLLLLTARELPYASAQSAASFTSARRFGERLLRDAPQRSVFLSEDSWFLVKYLRDIEGYRDDLVLIYTMQVMYPQLFRPAALTLIGLNDSRQFKVDPSRDVDPFARLHAFVDAVSTVSPIGFEPSEQLSNFFRPIARFSPLGFVYVAKNEPSHYDSAYLTTVQKTLASLRDDIPNLWKPLIRDTRHYLNAQITNTARMLRTAGRQADGIALLEDICTPLAKTVCMHVPLNNLAVYYIDAKRFDAAAILLFDVLQDRRNFRRELLQNLSVALNQLSTEEQTTLATNPFRAALIKRLVNQPVTDKQPS